MMLRYCLLFNKWYGNHDINVFYCFYAIKNKTNCGVKLQNCLKTIPYKTYSSKLIEVNRLALCSV